MSHVLLHASEILTGSGIVEKDGRKPKEEDLGKIEDGAIAFDSKKILWMGPTSQLPKRYSKFKRKNLKTKRAVIPAFVDCHTHLVFAGNRAEEFARRSAGVSYDQIASEGGGILKTVTATRAASEDELFQLGVERIEESLSYGVRTIEIKSGYGLNFATEIKILKVIQRLKKAYRGKMQISATFLGAHAFPKEVNQDLYLGEILNKMLPEVAKKNLADACDVFVDSGYFNVDQAKLILDKAKRLGLSVKIHADELGFTYATELAVELKATSADHLLKISDSGIQKISQSNTVAVLLPGTAFFLKADYAPARKLIDEGACVALSTDFNPGTCTTLSLPTIMTLGALYMKMSRPEIFAAVTYNAAKALGLEKQRGSLAVGMSSQNILEIPCERFEELYYKFSWNPAFSASGPTWR